MKSATDGERREEARMTKKHDPKAPAAEEAPEPEALERMRDLTRRIIQVPKSELPKKPASGKKHRRSP